MTSDPMRGILLAGNEVRLYSSENLQSTAGPYTLKVYPATPDVRYTKTDAASFKVSVKNPILNIEINAPKRVFMDTKRPWAVSFKPVVTLNWGDKTFAPGVTKVKWEILNKDGDVPTAADNIYGMISVNNNGEFTISKKYQLSKNAADNQFIIRAKPADFEMNDISDQALVEIVGTRIQIASIEIGKITNFDNEVLSSDLLMKEIKVKDINGEYIDPNEVTIISNDVNNFIIGHPEDPDELEDTENEHVIRDIKKSGKFVILVGARDCGKSHIKQEVIVKAAKPSSYKLTASAYYFSDSSADISFNKDNEAQLDMYPNYIIVRSKAESSDETILVNNSTVTVKGGKKRSNIKDTKGLTQLKIKPTSDKITITHKYGKGKDAVNETYTIKINNSKIKAEASKNKYNIWAEVEEQHQELEFNVSGVDDTTAGKYYLRFDLPDTYSDKYKGYFDDLIWGLNNTEPVELDKDSRTFKISADLYAYEGFPSVYYNLNATLCKGTQTDEGIEYTPVSDGFVVKFYAIMA